MVVDHRGRVCWGTSQLAELLGYPLKTLLGLELQAIMPPPYAQLHRTWMRVGMHVEQIGGASTNGQREVAVTPITCTLCTFLCM